MPPLFERQFSPYDVPHGPGGPEFSDDGQGRQGPPEFDDRGDQPEERRERADQPDAYEDEAASGGIAHETPKGADKLSEDIHEAADTQPVTFFVPSETELASQSAAIQALAQDGLGHETSETKVSYMAEAVLDTSRGAQTVMAFDDETGQLAGAMTVRPYPAGDGSHVVWGGVDEAFMQEARQWAEAQGVPLQAGYVQAVVVASERQGEGIASGMLRMADAGYTPAVWVAVTRNPDYALMQSHALGDAYRTFIGARQEITPNNVQETTVHDAVALTWMRAFSAAPDTRVHMDTFALSGSHEEQDLIQTSSLPSGVREAFEQLNELQRGLDDEGAALLVTSIRSDILDQLDQQQSLAVLPRTDDLLPEREAVDESSKSLFVRTPVIHEDVPSKPELRDMEAYFAARLHLVEPPDSSVVVEQDALDNVLYMYPGIWEETLAGESPAMTMVSPDGQDLLRHNPNLVQDLYRGNLTPAGQPFDTRRSTIYRVPLLGATGEEDYAVKYAFPFYEDMDRTYDHMSGIMAMRLMQYAQQERPIPYITYICPIIATHIITVAPFAYNGLSVESFLGRGLPDDSRLPLAEMHQLREMKVGESALKEKFFAALEDIVSTAGMALTDWTGDMIKRHPEFRAFHLRNADADLHRQGVISVGDIYEVYRRFVEDPSYRESGRLKEDVLKNIALIELADAFVELPVSE